MPTGPRARRRSRSPPRPTSKPPIGPRLSFLLPHPASRPTIEPHQSFSRQFKICPECPEPTVITGGTVSNHCVRCTVKRLDMKKVMPNTKSGGCRRVKICTECLPHQTPVILSWLGIGESQWDCINTCGIPQHGSLTVFHAMRPLATSELVLRENQPKTEEASSERQSGPSEEFNASIVNSSMGQGQKRNHTTAFKDYPNNLLRDHCPTPAVPSFDIDFSTLLPKKPEPQQPLSKSLPKKPNLPCLTQSRKLNTTPLPAEEQIAEGDSDKENFQNFEKEYAYYAAKVRRLLAESGRPPRTYTREENMAGGRNEDCGCTTILCVHRAGEGARSRENDRP